MRQTLRILHVSDTHCALDNVAAVARIAAQGQHDCVVLTGDLAVYDHVKAAACVKEAEADAHSVLQALEAGHALPVYFLPGNHDAPTLMSLPRPETRVGSRAVNVHGRSDVVLAPGLIVCGLGGAVPGVQNGYIIWEGFPYTEHQTGELLQRAWAAREPADAQVLLLTHCGPYDVGTTVCVTLRHANPEPIQSGSTSLRRLLLQKDAQDRIVANLHGHTHDASGMAQIGDVAVINPGALQQGRYATIVLDREDGRWRLRSVQFVNL